jgi:hypothetical protein
MRHSEILTLIKIPYLLNCPLLFGSWQGQALVSLRKLTKSEGLQILDVGLLETFYARGYLPEVRTCFRQLITHNVYIDQLLDGRLRALSLSPALSHAGWQAPQLNRHESEPCFQQLFFFLGWVLYFPASLTGESQTCFPSIEFA